MVICLGWPSPATSSSLPAASLNNLAEVSGLFGVGHTSPPIWPCSGWGLPCHCCCQQRGGLLPHRFTLTLCSANRTRAVCSLWPFPSPCGAQALPGSLPGGARTFLGTLSGPRPSCSASVLNIAGRREGWKAGKGWSDPAFPLPSPRVPDPRQPPFRLLHERLERWIGLLPLQEHLPVLLPGFGAAAEPFVCRPPQQPNPAQHAPA
jgi:hypothetical protein